MGYGLACGFNNCQDFNPSADEHKDCCFKYGCSEGWEPYGDNCYKVLTVNQTWRESKMNCEDLDADLASIHSEREPNNFGEEDCLDINHHDYGLWNDDQCDYHLQAICKKPAVRYF